MGNTPCHRLILKHATKLLLGVALFWGMGSWAQDKQQTSTVNNNISSADRIARTLIDTLPESGVKNGLKRYYEILDPQAYASDTEVAISNTGLANYFQYHFSKNSCFANKALRFYHEVRTTTKGNQKTNPQDNRNDRPSLGDKAGANRTDLSPGWLYKKALKYTKGNPNAALTLIGMCGHDDKEQGDFHNSAVEASLQKLGLSHAELYELNPEDDSESPCPSWTSDFYIAGTLSKKADIDDGLKKKILKTQYPGKRNLQIASKNYHVLGAAFMTCQMIEAGLSPFLAVRVESLAANLYRGIRLCQNIEMPSNLFWKLQRHPEVRRQSLTQGFEETVLQKALEKGRNKSCLTKKASEDALCELLKTVGAPLDLSLPRLEKRAEGLLRAYMDNMVASGLYSSWHISGEVAGVSLPCSRDQLFGPHPFMKWLVAQAELPLNICGSGLSVESCRKALRTITSWEVDFDWTVSQHVAGAKFAASVCQPIPQGKTSLEAFCD